MANPFKTGSLISNKDSIILNPLSPKRFAYLVHCTNISVSVKASLGKSTTSFTYALLLSSNALLARILDNEKAETLGSFDVVSVLTEGRGVFISGVFSTTISCGFTTACNGIDLVSVAFV